MSNQKPSINFGNFGDEFALWLSFETKSNKFDYYKRFYLKNVSLVY